MYTYTCFIEGHIYFKKRRTIEIKINIREWETNQPYKLHKSPRGVRVPTTLLPFVIPFFSSFVHPFREIPLLSLHKSRPQVICHH